MSILREMEACIIMCKQIKKLLPYTYSVVIILVSPLFRLSYISWRDAPLVDYVKEFSNIVPLRGILDAITNAMTTEKVWYLRPLVWNLLIMVPVGLFYGYFMIGNDVKERSVVCVRYFVLFGFLYCIRVLMKLGSFDIDDILLNLVGVYFGMILVCHWKEKNKV